MASDYAAIRADNVRRYGTDIWRIGPMMLSDRYDDRTHFIYELLQNAEDALARHSSSSRECSVRFHLTDCGLRVSHFGKPFDEADVRGICGIDESTKELTAIGHQRCVQETAWLLADALRWLSAKDRLDIGALHALPLDGAKFSAGSMFEALFRATKGLLASEALLPRFGGGYAAAASAKLARTNDLRKLFDPARLAALFDADGELAWLSGDISQDRTPELRQYLMRELD